MEESRINQVESTEQIESNAHGGRRKGSGRKKHDYDAKWFAARGIDPLLAAEILARVCNEAAQWKRILTSPDDRIVLEAMKFHMLMRDGKPAQRIHVTSTNLTVSVDEITAARTIIAEILGQPSPNLGLSLITQEATGSSVVVNNETDPPPAEVSESSIMVGGDEGGKKGG